MPWEVRPDSGGYAVFNKETGKKMSRRPLSKERAEAQLRALYANVPEARRKESILAPLELQGIIINEFKGGPGNMPGLAKHLAHKLGGDPHFFSKCMADPELADYDEKAKAGICARAHKIDIGIWPGEHGGEHPMGPESKKKEVSATPTAAPGHGPDGIFSAPGLGTGAKKKRMKKQELKEFILEVFKGGPGSGNFGHTGRPGHVGGSGGRKSGYSGAGRHAVTGSSGHLSGGSGGSYSGGKPESQTMGLKKPEAGYRGGKPESTKIGPQKGTPQKQNFSKAAPGMVRDSVTGEPKKDIVSRGTYGEVKGLTDAERKKVARDWAKRYPLKTLRSIQAKAKASGDDDRWVLATEAIDRQQFGPKPKKRKEAPESGLMIFKEAKTGKYRWVAFSSNAFKDLDAEIVSMKALAADVARADQTGDYGPLRWWHVEGADLGTCDYNALIGRTLVESGTFTDNRVAEAIKEYGPDRLQLSIGFKHPIGEPDSQGVFHTIRRFERSILPMGRASNQLTSFFVKE